MDIGRNVNNRFSAVRGHDMFEWEFGNRASSGRWNRSDELAGSVPTNVDGRNRDALDKSVATERIAG